jgi:hypothetical protein
MMLFAGDEGEHLGNILMHTVLVQQFHLHVCQSGLADAVHTMDSTASGHIPKHTLKAFDDERYFLLATGEVDTEDTYGLKG